MRSPLVLGARMGERLLQVPLLPSDRVLRAESADGLRWTKDPSFRVEHPVLGRRMTYGAAVDDRGSWWFRASVERGDGWVTELGNGGSWRGLNALGLRHLYSPCWAGGLLFAVVDGPRVAAFDSGEDGWPVREVPLDWPTEGAGPGLAGLFVLRHQEGWSAWAGAGTSGALDIHRWTSEDGRRWAPGGVAIAGSPWAADPCVVALPGGGWRLYYRYGDRPALGNVIRSAVSTDLVGWEPEPGDRLRPGGRWDRHGVGFPHVLRAGDGWEMLYGGWWGRTPLARRTVRRWEGVTG